MRIAIEDPSIRQLAAIMLHQHHPHVLDLPLLDLHEQAHRITVYVDLSALTEFMGRKQQQMSQQALLEWFVRYGASKPLITELFPAVTTQDVQQAIAAVKTSGSIKARNNKVSEEDRFDIWNSWHVMRKAQPALLVQDAFVLLSQPYIHKYTLAQIWDARR